MTDRCDTCGRLAELYQLPDRRDNNCAECNADISTLVLLYRKLDVARPDSEHAADLEHRLVTILQRFLGRARFGASVHFYMCPETAGKENHINSRCSISEYHMPVFQAGAGLAALLRVLGLVLTVVGVYGLT